MKQTFIKTLLLLFVILIAAACGDDEKNFGYSAVLPEQAQLFVEQYFPAVEYASIERGIDEGEIEYEVKLYDGTELEFDEWGEWTSVSNKFAGVPSDILPMAIAADIATFYPHAVIYKVEKKLGGYEIDITGWELLYSKQGVLVRAERD